jgi:hypothetical protein
VFDVFTRERMDNRFPMWSCFCSAHQGMLTVGADGNMSRSSSAERQEDLLVETRRLLNTLNNENTDLKERNRALVEKLRAAEDAAREAKQSERELERDSKQLNFTLMQQVQARTDEARTAKVREEEATSKAREHARALESEREAHEDLKARHASLREQARMLEAKLLEERSSTTQTASDATRTREQLEATLTVERERLLAESRSHQSSAFQLREQLAAAERKVADLEAQVADQDADAKRNDSKYAAEVHRLKIAAQRTLDAESEASYAHDQMLSTADLVSHQLEAQAAGLHAVMRGVRESDASAAAALQRIEEQRAALQQLRSMDDTLEKVLKQTVAEVFETQSVTRGEAATMQDSAMTARLEAKQALGEAEDARRAAKRAEEEAQEATRAMHASQVALESERAECTTIRDELSRIEAASARLRVEAQEAREAARAATDRAAAAEHQAARERAELLEAQQAAESRLRDVAAEARRSADASHRDLEALALENEQLRRALDSHTASLAAELQRLQYGGSSARHESHAPSSHSYRASSDAYARAAHESASSGAEPIRLSPQHPSPRRPPPPPTHLAQPPRHVDAVSTQHSSRASSRSPSPAVATAATLAQRILASARNPTIPQ